MKTVTSSSPFHLIAGAATAAGLAISLTACGGGSGSDASEEQNAGPNTAQAAEQTAEQVSSEQETEQEGSEQEADGSTASEARQLSQEEIEKALNSISYEGESFDSVYETPGELGSAKEQYKEAEYDPAECKAPFLDLIGKPETELPNGYALNESNSYTAGAISYTSAEKASKAFDEKLKDAEGCEELTLEMGNGDTFERSITVEESEIPGADRAVMFSTAAPDNEDEGPFTVIALTGNGLVTADSVMDGTASGTLDVATEAVKAYSEASE